jgi:hypothetical protein
MYFQGYTGEHGDVNLAHAVGLCYIGEFDHDETVHDSWCRIPNAKIEYHRALNLCDELF